MIIDGKNTSLKIKKVLKEIIEKEKLKLGLAIISVGTDDASEVYVRNKQKMAQEIGINCYHTILENNSTEEEVINVIYKLNKNPNIHGIILQLPIPVHLNKEKIINAIDYRKDVDGLNYINQARLMLNSKEPYFVPCTAAGIKTLLQEYCLDLTGKKVAIINRSILIGKPLAALLTNSNATVTLYHSKSDLTPIYDADIVVSGIGTPHYFDSSKFKDNVVIIDASINRDPETNKLCGDFDIKDDFKGLYTPVPGGVGPMTVVMLMRNVLLSYSLKILIRY